MIKIERVKRKTISISIDALGEVKVKAPTFLSDNDIEKFINSKRKWIDKILSRMRLILSENSKILSKEEVYYLGKIVNYSEDFIKTIKHNANVYLPARIKMLADKFNFKIGEVHVKDYKSRWGTCYKNKNITLNYKLMMLDVKIIDYVILHELCHTVYFDHQKKFHSLLSSLIKNEKEIKRSLKEKSFLLKIKY